MKIYSIEVRQVAEIEIRANNKIQALKKVQKDLPKAIKDSVELDLKPITKEERRYVA